VKRRAPRRVFKLAAAVLFSYSSLLTRGSPLVQQPSSALGSPEFRTTHWSVVLAAADVATPQSANALETLCRAYWYPLYAHIRRRGYEAHAAQDLTQAFFEHLLANHSLGAVDRAKGKFRSFLLACLANFLAREWRDGHTLKRGGAVTFLSFDPARDEDRFAADASRDGSQETEFDRAWAKSVLEQALDRLERESTETGKAMQFAALKPFLLAPVLNGGYDAAAQALGMTPHAVGTAVMRLRRRFRDVVRDAVAHTVATPLELEEELRYFRQLLSQ
jgi:RNA polymerase sigma-70 factor (ECF subfamily)